ncbi:MAG: hypothetical protein ACRCXT_07295 [Paraclostridium sp.]
MNENCFITSDCDKAYIEKVEDTYLLIRDIYTDESFEIEVDEHTVEHFRNECSDGEVVYIGYDKKTKRLI